MLPLKDKCVVPLASATLNPKLTMVPAPMPAAVSSAAVNNNWLRAPGCVFA